MTNRLIWALAPLALLLLGGCNSLASGPARDRPEAFSAAAFKLDPSWNLLNSATDWDKIPFGSRKAARNEFVTARMYLIDRAYYDFESTMLQDTRTGGFLGDLFVSALTSGAAIIDDRQIQRAMSTAATAVVGGRQAFDKQVLMDRTIQTLQNQMRANRADVKARILERLRSDYEDWPIGLAQSDLEEYYQAGTLVSALTAAADSASARKVEEEAEANLAVTSAFQTDTFTEAFRAYLRHSDAAVRQSRRERAQGLLDAQRTALGKPKMLFAVFIDQGSVEDKKKLVTSLHDVETGDMKKLFADALAGVAPAAATAAPTTNPETANAASDFIIAFQIDAATEALRAYIRQGDANERKRRRDKAQEVLDVQRSSVGKVKIPVAAFLDSGGLDDKKKLLQALHDVETGAAKQQLAELLITLN